MPVRQCDIYMGQPDDPESFELFFPAVFVDWAITPGGPGEEDLIVIDFHIVEEPGTHSENFSNRLNESLNYIKRIKAVKYLMNRLRASNSTPLTYNGERPRTTPFFKYHIVSYKCYIDADTESIWRSEMDDTIPNDVGVVNRNLKETETKPIPSPIIDTY